MYCSSLDYVVFFETKLGLLCCFHGILLLIYVTIFFSLDYCAIFFFFFYLCSFLLDFAIADLSTNHNPEVESVGTCSIICLLMERSLVVRRKV